MGPAMADPNPGPIPEMLSLRLTERKDNGNLFLAAFQRKHKLFQVSRRVNLRCKHKDKSFLSF